PSKAWPERPVVLATVIVTPHEQEHSGPERRHKRHRQVTGPTFGDERERYTKPASEQHCDPDDNAFLNLEGMKVDYRACHGYTAALLFLLLRIAAQRAGSAGRRDGVGQGLSACLRRLRCNR